MEKKFKLGVIGAGFMATSIIKGALSAKIIENNDIIVYDVNKSQTDKMLNIGVNVATSNIELANKSEFVLFAIKPQEISNVLDEIKGTSCKKFISIMAGIKKQRIKNTLSNVNVVRCMPNTPCSIKKGAIGVDFSDFTEKSDIEFINNLFSSLGVVVSVREELFGAVTGVSGSAPAYFYTFVNAIIKSGVKNGLTEEQAKNLAVSTMIGAGEMIKNNPEQNIQSLINAVCSKGGTTIEAIKVFEQENLDLITDKAISACIKRSSELENL